MYYILRLNRNSRKSLLQMRELAARHEFQVAIQKLENDFGEKNLWKFQDAYDLLNNYKYRNKIREMLRPLGLHIGWEFFVAYILIYKCIPTGFNPSLPYLEEIDYEESGHGVSSEPVFNLRIFPTTTKEDLLEALGMIKQAMSPKQKRLRDKPNLYRDADILRMHREGKSPKVIAAEINKKYPGNPLIDNDIYKVIHKSRKVPKTK